MQMPDRSNGASVRARSNRAGALGCALSVISGKWRAAIICELFAGTRRYGELRKSLPGITQCVLTSQLRELQRLGIISRKVFPTTPPAVEYSLTARGEGLQTVFETLRHWGEKTCGEISEN